MTTKWLSFCYLLVILITCSSASPGASTVQNHDHHVTIATLSDQTVARHLFCFENTGLKITQFAWFCVVPNANVHLNDLRNNYCLRAAPVGRNHAEAQLLTQLDGLINRVGRANAAYVFIYSWLIPCSDVVNCAQQIADASLRIRLPFLLYYHFGYRAPHPEYTDRSINILRNGNVDVFADTEILQPPCP